MRPRKQTSARIASGWKHQVNRLAVLQLFCSIGELLEPVIADHLDGIHDVLDEGDIEDAPAPSFSFG